MKKQLLSLLYAVFIAVCSALATFALVAKLVTNDSPLTYRLGLQQYRPVYVYFDEIPGSYGEKLKFLTSGITGNLIIPGLPLATKKTPLNEIAKAPIAFFHGGDQPITAALDRTFVLVQIADRVNKGERPDKAYAEALAQILDQGEAIAASLQKAAELESRRDSSGSSLMIKPDATEAFKANAKKAAALLRQP